MENNGFSLLLSASSRHFTSSHSLLHPVAATADLAAVAAWLWPSMELFVFQLISMCFNILLISKICFVKGTKPLISFDLTFL